jgi:ribosomal-protein-alanine N-acetyltransferase
MLLAYYVRMLYSSDAAVRDAVPTDIESIVALAENAGNPRWSRAHYLESFASGSLSRLVLVAEGKGGIVGFIMCRAVDSDCEIENVVVAVGMRRKGIGDLLLARVVERARERGAARLMLEVRASNAAAIALYKKHAFQQDGIRKNYYSNPSEDALLFSLSLGISS